MSKSVVNFPHLKWSLGLVLLLLVEPLFAQFLDQTEVRERTVQRTVYSYFKAKDGGAYRNAYSYLSLTGQEQVPYARWMDIVGQFNREAGPVISRSITKITWFRNPQNVAPGLYCSVDFVAKFKNIDNLFGYLSFQLDENGKFLIIREEQNYMKNK